MKKRIKSHEITMERKLLDKQNENIKTTWTEPRTELTITVFCFPVHSPLNYN